ncbi:hypothetical protein Syun_006226 [Stephania yunnanensis]|uniref:Uncharacterized protein n=1 Tax=Stephania yunnanensis TaxID=152371 RepID=A0AAP0KYU1_9MAGN
MSEKEEREREKTREREKSSGKKEIRRDRLAGAVVVGSSDHGGLAPAGGDIGIMAARARRHGQTSGLAAVQRKLVAGDADAGEELDDRQQRGSSDAGSGADRQRGRRRWLDGGAGRRRAARLRRQRLSDAGGAAAMVVRRWCRQRRGDGGGAVSTSARERCDDVVGPIAPRRGVRIDECRRRDGET